MGPEAIKEIAEQRTALIADVRVNRDIDPASAEARAVAARWNSLIPALPTPVRIKLWKAIGENYEQNRYTDVEQAPRAEDFDFIRRVDETHSPPSGQLDPS